MRPFLLVASICLAAASALALLAVTRTSSSPAAGPRTVAAAPLEPPTPPAKPAARPAPTFTLVAGGDISLAGEPRAALLAGVRRFLGRADLAFANLEGALSAGGSARCLADAKAGCFVFRASPGWAPTLRRSGLTVLNVANNHALDFGRQGQAETLAALRGARLAFDGLPGQITRVRAGAVRVALIGCAPYGWAQSLLDTKGTQALVRRAARSADVVIVYMHAGAEGAAADHVTGGAETYLGEPRGNPRQFAHAMVDAGADLVLGSGPHVLRGLEWYRGRLIAYSLGNLASSHTLSSAGVLARSALLRLTLDAHGRFVGGALIPLELDAWGAPSFDPGRRSLALVRALSLADFGPRAARVGPAGRIS